MSDDLKELIGQEVVLDTAGPIVYLGQLESIDESGFWLSGADFHNCNEGHATREQYIAESKIEGIHVNRERIHVFRHAVLSLSPLSAVSG